MIIQFPKPISAADTPLGLADIHETLVMLSLALALIASPKIPIDRARIAAKDAQKVAEAYVDVVAAMIDQGGEQ
ncbi:MULTISPECIES: hypothetical protein [unclassified Pseudomonas]|uniref:hypothetical protein n=1 Tax=unclassified Pseudomonas TaxID=196821 RepID=UPI000D38FB1C|nr:MULTISPECIES: hypothetical protein [unclassified Pseudomonas]RAU43680.1 hypothetical protein DBP26_019320 [Pseudomonas sp. RIT 409]RAU54388.1 hypothetical protein DBY65_008650 [Pseudomonas sp. RIT 412]